MKENTKSMSINLQNVCVCVRTCIHTKIKADEDKRKDMISYVDLSGEG